jgi:four helix bundle protein
MPGFEQLEVWQKAVALSVDVYRRMAGCPDFGFRDQATRSALSVASNIAEGMERRSIPDKIKFLDYARGSCGEFRTQATVGQRAGLLDDPTADRWIETSRELSAMIQGLIRSFDRPPLGGSGRQQAVRSARLPRD